jgi:hypothetical protein
MDRKLAAVIAVSIFLAVSTPVAVPAEIFVGVKQGDWIEYQVTYTGTPPEGHTVTWAIMNITSVQGRNITLAVAAKMSNGTWLNEIVPLNPETGQLGDDFIIPANLSSGDTFFDKWQGNITINEVGEKTYAGAKRAYASGTTSQSKYYWDRATGVLVEGNSSYVDFSMYTRVEATNMWQPQAGEVDSIIVYALLIGAVVIVALAISYFIVHLKK